MIFRAVDSPVTHPGAPADRATRAVERASALLHEATEAERAGRVDAACERYGAAIRAAEEEGDAATLSEALRRLAIAQHQRSDATAAYALARRSLEVAVRAGARLLSAQALNTLAAFDLAAGQLDAARTGFLAALGSAGEDQALKGRIEQNLGIIANIQGDLARARTHYGEALAAFAAAGDDRGCAMAYNSLGMISADERRWEDAETYFGRCLALTTRLADVHLHALALLSQTEVLIARQRYHAALENATEALRIFDQLGAFRHKSDAYRVLGVVYRETGRAVLAESRLVAAMDAARSLGLALEEAEAARELAELHRRSNRNQDALRLLNTAHRLFTGLSARADAVDVASRVEALEGAFLALVRDWGQSIESADSYTHGHCERVAHYALEVARELGLGAADRTTVRIGAYLHDVGKVRVPHEILNKPGPLTPAEMEIMRRHPVDGVELLEGIEFPWDIAPMIRWHHERWDGTGYPDGLRGDEIPLHAQIICIVDVFDALTTTRSYRPGMSREAALVEIHAHRGWWRADVFEAFLRAVADLPVAEAGEGG